jgi:hypothetical protein
MLFPCIANVFQLELTLRTISAASFALGMAVKLLGSEYQTGGICAKRAKQATKTDNDAAFLCFLNYLAFLWSEADQTGSILPWVVSQGCLCGFLWAGSIIQINVRKDNPTPAYSPVSDRRRRTALVEVYLARRAQAPIPRIRGPNLQENHIIETCKEEGCAVFTQETATKKEDNILVLARRSGWANEHNEVASL